MVALLVQPDLVFLDERLGARPGARSAIERPPQHGQTQGGLGGRVPIDDPLDEVGFVKALLMTCATRNLYGK